MPFHSIDFTGYRGTGKEVQTGKLLSIVFLDELTCYIRHSNLEKADHSIESQRHYDSQWMLPVCQKNYAFL